MARTAEEFTVLRRGIGDVCHQGWADSIAVQEQPVITVVHGQRGTTGYTIVVDSVRLRGEATWVYASAYVHGECGVGDMITNPVDVITTKLGTGPLRLVRRTIVGGCEDHAPSANDR